jgi:hypothetical protein
MSSEEETGITRTEYNEWLRSKVSKYVVENLTAMREARIAELLSGATLDPANIVTPEYAIGFIAGQSIFLDMKFLDEDEKTVSSYGH